MFIDNTHSSLMTLYMWMARDICLNSNHSISEGLGNVIGSLSYVEIKGNKSGSRGRKLYISQVHEHAHLEVQLDKKLSLVWMIRKS